MQKLLILSFILASHFAHADLRNALSTFEKAERFHQQAINFGAQSLLAEEKKKPVLIRLKESVTAKAKPLFQSCADEFMDLRKKGSTLPIAYLRYMKENDLAKIDQDIEWENTLLNQIESTRNAEHPEYEKHYPFPRIPRSLIQESQEHFITSVIISEFTATADKNTKEQKLKFLLKHFKESLSYNLRAFFHLYQTLVKDKWAPQAKSDFKEILDLITRKKVAAYVKKAKIKQESHPACFLDPEFMLLMATDITPREPLMAEYRQAYTRNDAIKIQIYHLQRGFKHHRATGIINVEDFATALQQGEINTSLAECSPHSRLAGKHYEDSMPNVYFSFLGAHLLRSAQCAQHFEVNTQPFCSAYKNRNAKESFTAADPYSQYLLLNNKNSDKAFALLHKAATEKNLPAMYLWGKHLVEKGKSRTQRSKGLSWLKRVIADHSGNTEVAFDVLAKAHIATLYLQYDIGSPHQAIRYAREAVESRDRHAGDKVPYSLLAYFYTHGIACKKNKAEAKRLKALDLKEAQQKQKPVSLWHELLDFEDKIRETCTKLYHDDGALNVSGELLNLGTRFKQGGVESTWSPTPYFLLEKIFNYTKKQHINEDNPPIALVAAMMIVFKDVREEKHSTLELFAARLMLTYPKIYEDLTAHDDTKNENSARSYIEKAIAYGYADALLLKAECILKKQAGYGEGNNREKQLREALILVRKNKRKYNLEDQILMGRIRQELQMLEKQNKPIIVECDDESTEDSSDNDEVILTSAPSSPIGGGAAPSIAAAAAAAAYDTDDNDDDIPLSPAEIAASQVKAEWDGYVTQAKKRSAEKKRSLQFRHEMELPDANANQSDTATNFNVNSDTAEFINMVYGFGKTRIHHYDVPSALAVFKDLGLKETSEHMQWTYTDAEGIIHKLSFHIPHGRKENKLYLAIRQRIKHFFMRVGITPEHIEIK